MKTADTQFKYIEKFVVGPLTFHISVENGVYKCWSSGCAIGGTIFRDKKTIQECRRYILEYAVEELKRRIKNAQTIVKKNTEILNDLGDDEFNLGIFKVKVE